MPRSVARSVRLSVARPQTAHLTWLLCSFSFSPFPRTALPSLLRLASSRLLPPSFPPAPAPVRCLLSVYRGRTRSLVGRCGRSDGRRTRGRCSVRRPFRDLGLGQFPPTDERMPSRRASPKPTGLLPFPIEANARERPRKRQASKTR